MPLFGKASTKSLFPCFISFSLRETYFFLLCRDASNNVFAFFDDQDFVFENVFR